MKARILILLMWAVVVVGAFGQDIDSALHVKQFPGYDVGTKVKNAMAACAPDTNVPCILVIDPSLATAAPGTLPPLCPNCSLMDYRTRSAAAGASSYVSCAGTSKDAATINNALAQSSMGISHVVVVGPACNIGTSPLVIASNTWVDVSPVTSISYTGTDQALINASALTPQRVQSGASMTAGSATLAFSEASGTSADVGRTVYVPDGIQAGEVLVGTVIAYVDAHTETLNVSAQHSTGPVSATFYNRDKNITVTGGNWTSAGLSTLKFRHVDNLTIEGGAFNTPTRHNYSVWWADATHVTARDLYFNGVNGNAVHVHGPSQFFTIQNIHGSSTDDFVALTTIDSTTYDDTLGDITDGVIAGLYNSGTGHAPLIEGGYGTKLRNISVRDIYSYSVSGLVVDDYPSTAFVGPTDIDGLSIENVHTSGSVILAPGAGKSMKVDGVYSNAGAFTGGCLVCLEGTATDPSFVWQDASISNVVPSAQTTGLANAVQVNAATQAGAVATIGQLRLKGIHAAPAALSFYPAIQLISSSGGSTNVGSMTVADFSVDDAFGANNAAAFDSTATIGTLALTNVRETFTGASTNGNLVSLAGTVDSLQIHAAQMTCTGTSGSLVRFAGTVRVWSLDGLSMNQCGATFTYAAGSAVGNGTATNVQLDGSGGFGYFLTNADLSISNSNFKNLASVLLYTSGATVRVRGGGLNADGTWNGLTRAGSEAVYSSNPDFRVDVAKLTHVANDLAYNIEPASGPVGRVIDTGSTWSSFVPSVATIGLASSSATGPTACAVTGAGSTGSCALDPNSFTSGSMFTVDITAGGSGVASTGVITLTFPAGLATHAIVCRGTPAAYSYIWAAGASFQPTNFSSTAPTVRWDNNGVALTAGGGTYGVIMWCTFQ